MNNKRRKKRNVVNVNFWLKFKTLVKSKQIIDTARYNPTEGKPGIAQANALKEVWKGGAPVK